MKKVKRALTLAGGGPAVGLSIGTLKKFDEEGMKFDIWASACIGAWLSVIYNQAEKGHEIEETISIFEEWIFQKDDIYSAFPIAKVFAPRFGADAKILADFMMDPNNYTNLFLPQSIINATQQVFKYMAKPNNWSHGNFNSLILNSFMAVNPVVRFMTNMMYNSGITGLSSIYSEKSTFLNYLKWDKLKKKGRPLLYHNAFNLNTHELDYFSNRPLDIKDLPFKPLAAKTLCACSALPYIEEPVTIDDQVYCEGATIECVNFDLLLTLCEKHGIEEVWISQIVNPAQVHAPKSLDDALNNLIMLFAGSVSDDDVMMFLDEIEKRKSKLKVINVPVSPAANYDWNNSNLHHCIEEGYKAAEEIIEEYKRNPKQQIFGINRNEQIGKISA